MKTHVSTLSLLLMFCLLLASGCKKESVEPEPEPEPTPEPKLALAITQGSLDWSHQRCDTISTVTAGIRYENSGDGELGAVSSRIVYQQGEPLWLKKAPSRNNPTLTLFFLDPDVVSELEEGVYEVTVSFGAANAVNGPQSLSLSLTVTESERVGHIRMKFKVLGGSSRGVTLRWAYSLTYTEVINGLPIGRTINADLAPYQGLKDNDEIYWPCRRTGTYSFGYAVTGCRVSSPGRSNEFNLSAGETEEVQVTIDCR